MEICDFETREEVLFPNKLLEIIKEYGKPKKNNLNRY